jgi:hypothetical protein
MTLSNAIPGPAHSGLPFPGQPGLASRRFALFFVIAFPIFYGFLSLAVGQDASWDFENYHWYNAYAFLTGREGRDILVSQTPSFYNPLLDVIFYLAASHLPARLVGFALGAVQGMNGVLIFLLARMIIRRPPLDKTLLAILVSVSGMIGGGVLGEIGATFWDNVVSLGFLGGLLILTRFALQPGLAARWAAPAGLILGAAAGFKQLHLLYCASVGLSVLCLPGSFARRTQIAAWLAAGGLAGIGVTSGFWLAHMTIAYGNPLFPYFNTVFHSPFAAINRDFRDTNFIPKSLWVRLLFPIYFTIDPLITGEVEQRGTAMLALFLALPASLLLLASRRFRPGREPSVRLTDPAASRFILVVITVSYLLWLKMFCIYRYVAPIEMLAPLGLMLAFDLFPASARARISALAMVLAVCVVANTRGDWGRAPWGERYVEIQAPKLAPDTLVLMAGYEPLGFIVPGLPPELPVLRIQSNFVHPGDSLSRFTTMMKARIADHKGPLALIYLRQEQSLVDEALAEYGLVADLASCADIPNSLDDRGILLCGVAKAP